MAKQSSNKKFYVNDFVLFFATFQEFKKVLRDAAEYTLKVL